MDKLLIEHVAEAISPWRAGKDMRKVMMVDWQSLREEVKEAYRNQAIAAIEAYESYSSNHTDVENARKILAEDDFLGFDESEKIIDGIIKSSKT